MKKSSDQEGFFNIYPFITSPSTLDQDEQKTHPAIKLKYWVSRNSVILLILVGCSSSVTPVDDGLQNQIFHLTYLFLNFLYEHHDLMQKKHQHYMIWNNYLTFQRNDH